jgi:exocyst complex component 4
MSRNHSQHGQHARSSSAIPKGLASLANEYRRLAIDCVRVLRLEMQLEAIYHMQVLALKLLLASHSVRCILCQKKVDQHKFEQEMTKREYMEDQDAEDPDDFIISLTTQVSTLESFISLASEDIYIES